MSRATGGSAAVTDPAFAVRAEEVVKHYDGGLVEALKGVSFHIEIGEMLAIVGPSHRIAFLPVKCSGGERQRAAIARALVNEPKILLADEPTGSVDTVTGDSLFGLFRELHAERRMTVVIITHNDKLGSEVDRV